jgi:Porin PorA
LRRTKIGLGLIVLGCIVLALVPAWRFGIGPLFIRLPDDLEVLGAYTGEMTVFADQRTSTFYPPGQEVTTPLRIESRDAAVPELSDDDVLVLREAVSVSDASTGEPLEGLRPETMYVLDRRTCENVPGVIEGIDRRGFTVKLPMRVEKKIYALWDDELGASIPCRYVREARLDGDGFRGLRVYVFEAGGSMEKMVKPPPGVPETVTGKQAKAMTGNQNLPLADNLVIRPEYFKRTDAVLYVEPATGTTVHSPSHSYTYYVKNPAGSSESYKKLARVSYSKDAASAARDISDTIKYARLIQGDMRAVPLALLVLGLAIIAAGVFLRRRTSRADGRARGV